jgi:segregation and condensation protein B
MEEPEILEPAPETPEELKLESESSPPAENTNASAPAGNDEPQDDSNAPAAAELPDEKLRSIMEVLLLVSDRPLSVPRIQEVIEGLSRKRIQEAIGQIEKHLEENGFPFQVREVANGYLLSTLPEYAPWVRKFYAPKLKTSKLSQAALETLAVIAYKQPITRAEVEAIRGVNIDSTLRTLLEKRLVEIVGYKDVIGKPATYGTTNEFLLQFGLKALSELPSIGELRAMKTEA